MTSLLDGGGVWTILTCPFEIPEQGSLQVPDERGYCALFYLYLQLAREFFVVAVDGKGKGRCQGLV